MHDLKKSAKNDTFKDTLKMSALYLIYPYKKIQSSALKGSYDAISSFPVSLECYISSKLVVHR